MYLPPDYAAGGRPYPVLYMLHGVGGNYTEWTVDHLPEPADDMIYVENFHQLALDQGIEVAWHEFAGGHEGAYWSAHVPDYPSFVLQPGAPARGRTTDTTTNADR